MSRRRVLGYLADDTGATAVLLAVSFVVIIGFMALVVDVGMAATADRRLQSAVDAAALAGCEHYIQGSAGDAATVARTYVLRHATGLIEGMTASDITVAATNPGGMPTMQVTARRNISLPFGSLFGREVHTVTATSKAQGQRLSGARYVAPFAFVISEEYHNVRYEVRTTAGAVVRSGTLSPDATGLTWTGSFAAPTDPARYDVFITYQNSRGITETLWDTRLSRSVPACMVFTRGAGQPVSDVSATGPLFVEMLNATQVYAPHAAWPTVSATVNGTAGTALAAATGSTDAHILTSNTISVGGQPVAYLHPRRGDAPFSNVRVSPVVADPDAPVQLTVTFSGADPRKRTTTMGIASAVPRTMYLRSATSYQYSGDCVELDLDSISHASCGASAFSTAGLTGLDRLSRVVKGYPAPLHVGDRVPLYPSVSNYGFNGYNVRRADGRIYAVAPVVVRYSPTDAQVVGFVTVLIDAAPYGINVAAVRCYGDYTATPHEFSATPAPPAGSNGVMAARLVRP